ncbi:MAG: class I SAM-dependent methyltransferase [Bacteroidales bacterium]|nr:class I SAM-dependent methyltransferase [Bacteroidales bacterium]
MQKNYWINFWKEHAKKSKGKNNQVQVLRTIHRNPIDTTTWETILKFVLFNLDIKHEDIVLDLFGGNGLFAVEIAKYCRRVDIVDVSEELLNTIDREKYNNIITKASDIRKIALSKNEYNKILIYAGIQYLTRKETIELFLKVFEALQKGGICYIGDIPDEKRIWNFYNNTEREASYFQSLLDNSPQIGTWFDDFWLEKLTNFVGFSSFRKIDQKKEMIYSHFRFDAIIKK